MEEAPQNALVPVRGGSVTVGRKWDGTRFYGWDNEFGAPVEKELRDFEVSKMLVSNAESKAKFHRSQSSCRCFEPTYNFFTNILRFFREFFDMRLRTYLSNPLQIRGNGKAQYECEIFFEEC